jgi:hypothetical protein
VRILERNKELEAEAAEAKAKTLPTVNLGAGGLNVSTDELELRDEDSRLRAGGLEDISRRGRSL